MKQYQINKFTGRPLEIGIAVGKSVGDRLAYNIDKLVSTVDKTFGLDKKRLTEESLAWLDNLPDTYQDELRGSPLGPDVRLKSWPSGVITTDVPEVVVQASFITLITTHGWEEITITCCPGFGVL